MAYHKLVDYLVMKANVYHYRRKVPVAVIEYFDYKEIYSHTLETGNKVEAKRIANELTNFFDSVVRELKRNSMIEHRRLNTKVRDLLEAKIYSLLHPSENIDIKNLLFSGDTHSNKLLTFKECIDRFMDYSEKVKHLKGKTLRQYQSPLLKFHQLADVKYIDELTKDVLRTVDKELRKQLSLPTLKQYYTCFKVFLNYIKDEYKDIIAINTIIGIVDELSSAIKAKSRRNSFTDLELQEIFGIEYFNKCPKLQTYLIGLLLLTTGMRPVEIAKLHVEDVKMDISNSGKEFIYFDIKNRYNSLGQSSLKTPQSERMIPLCADLPFIKQLYDYIADRIKTVSPDSKLFDMNEKYISESMSKIIRSTGIRTKDENKSAYSLRHNYTQKLAYAGVQPYVIDYLTGHSTKSISQTVYFGKSHDIKYLYDEVCKCDFSKALCLLLEYGSSKNKDLDTVINDIIDNTEGVPNLRIQLGEEEYQKTLYTEEQIEELFDDKPKKTIASSHNLFELLKEHNK